MDICIVGSRSNSVSVVSDYGLNDRANGVRSPAEAKDFPVNLCVQTGSEVHPASCTVGTGGPFPGAKRGRGVTLTTHPHLMPSPRMSMSYPPLPPIATLACSRTALLIFIVWLWLTSRRVVIWVLMDPWNVCMCVCPSPKTNLCKSLTSNLLCILSVYLQWYVFSYVL
jgi:hypothetical protein